MLLVANSEAATFGAKPFQLQELRQQFTQLGVVVDDEYGVFHPPSVYKGRALVISA